MFVSVSVIIGYFKWAPGQFTLKKIQCYTRKIPYQKVHGYVEIVIQVNAVFKIKVLFCAPGWRPCS